MSTPKKALNILLLITFIVTILVPLTGIHVHKMASSLFLLLTVFHTIAYRRKLGAKKYLLFAIVVSSYASGILGLIFEEYQIILILHKVISIASVFFIAIHIFIYQKSMIRTFRSIFDTRIDK